ncbi:U3 small nucleolar RNA-associated protein Utp11, putative [Talaromyces stipitatus ATCC 10500]|uniref:U3 small nucleolar RNA-associated protein Utp11, putative n=1 Tax=Talaromyces stipitatus (strain ATCC 10500 / CBS 375.48 / QM 6759 / NRRL 1006) TaxID=441959 RepID=B8M2Z4_TALSN|nr:U3 small nucleolar RNA-associated protein Utp11, putative [Talaromyces stipitatus ATCC 10500]EED22249.1 U3 small nucleolar RNA-associated protein Utp11, putative [Talaromyces stipitatus ATCC 10500]
MSSMRNAVHRRQHRERGQLEGREKWGILEKHKDYSLRAKDYNLKQQKLQRLREKARDRNPDEFAYGMLSDKNAQQGKHGAREGTSLSHDTVKLLKTQDAGYLRTIGERIRREMERLEKEVQLQDGMEKVLGSAGNKKRHSSDDEDEEDDEDEMSGNGNKRRKLIFADSREDQKELGRKFDEDDNEDEEEEDEEDDAFGTQLHNLQRQPTKKELEAQRKAVAHARAARKIKRRAAEGRRNKLAALRKQYAEITTAERELELQRAKMSNSVGGVNKKGVKFKIRERKR